MTPSQQRLRLQSMLRAMSEVIVPALDPQQQLARDQAKIVIGNLQILMDQTDSGYDFLLTELREYASLLRELISLSGEGAIRNRALEVLSVADPVAVAHIPGQRKLRELVSETKQTVNVLLEAVLDRGAANVRARAASLVLAQSEQQVLRERAWLRSSGFDPDQKSLPPIEAVLAFERDT